MEGSYIIGIDIGTGSTKAVAVDGAGAVLCTEQQYYTSTTGGGKSEQDVSLVYNAFLKCIAGVVTTMGREPAAISLSSAMHSLLAVGPNGEPLTPAMLWSDTRSSVIAEGLRSSPEGAAIYLATGTPLHSMSPLCKIKWLRDEQPAVFAGAHAFVSIKETIWHRLFNEFVIDHSIASATGLFNLSQLDWDEEALQFAGINKQQLSRPVPVTYTRRGLTGDAANAMQLSADTLFMVGASDGTLANLGSLCLSPTEAAITIGTSAAVRITSAVPVPDVDRMIFNYLLDEGTFICGGAVNNGGNIFQWLLQNLFAQHKTVNNYEQLFQSIADVPPGSHGLLFLPYIHGERAPVWDENSSGAFVGVQASHTLQHFARAAAEGVCFALNDILSALEQVCGRLNLLSVSGGIVQEKEMMQLLADVTGKKVVVQQREDASAIGAVYLAQKALGIIDSYTSISEQEAVFYLPRPAAQETYRTLFPVYQSLYPVLKEQMHVLHQLTR